MKLSARVIKSASGTEIFLTTAFVKDPKSPDGPMIPDSTLPQVNTVLRLPVEAGFESGLFNAELTLTAVPEPKAKAEEASKS